MYFRIIILFLAYILLGFALTEGLRCLTCENADSIEECDRLGNITLCDENQDSCEMVVRYNGGWQLSSQIKVFKFCKQSHACAQNQLQNSKEAWAMTQCNPKYPDTVCRCCCEGDECNRGDLKCLTMEEPPTCFPSLPQPENGKIHCSDGSNVGSVCTSECKRGYYISGSSVSKCQDNKRWTYAPATCESSICPDLKLIQHGNYICSNEKYVGSICSFSCKSGYRLVGPELSICQAAESGGDEGIWTTGGQYCERKRCDNQLSAPKYGNITCSDEDFVDSNCIFTCGDEYELVGPTEVLCVEGSMYSNPHWDYEAPSCKRKECRNSPRFPSNGYMVCTDGKFMNSICEFFCDENFYLMGPVITVCTNIQYSELTGEKTTKKYPSWSEKTPACKRKYCKSLPKPPPNGGTYCNDGHYLGSVCSFSCDESYYLIGAGSSTCIEGKSDDMPHWDEETPECKRKRCGNPPDAPLNGELKCSEKDFLGSVCEFTCEKDYHRNGNQLTICSEDGNGKLSWDRAAPECIRKECSSNPKAPTNGFVICSDMKFLGSVCQFSCGHAYDIVGSEISTCMEEYETHLLKWDNEYPECIRKECSYMPKIPAHGSMSCSDKKFYGSVCTFTCYDDYKRIGPSYIMCELSEEVNPKPKWDFESPYCEKKKCDAIQIPDNGFIDCTDDKYIGSKCVYGCEETHTLVGDTQTICEEDSNGYMKWKNQAPVCELITCPVLRNLKFGEVNCTDGHNVNSECKFQCTGDGYSLYPGRRDSIKCKYDTMWSAKPPCCARSCPPYALMDLIVILDSSSSIGASSWKVMLKFVNSIFDLFIVQPDAMNFGVVRYNRKVDTKTRINLNECPGNVTMLKHLVSKLPYNGQGTWTGQAISYVHEHMLKPEYGNRKNAPDVVLVITDGRSQDSVKMPAEELRKSGVLTFALGITPGNGNLDYDQLMDIAGSESRLSLAEYGFGTLTPEFAREISRTICGDPCEHQ
ncbi:P-selectin-like [Styela clava]